MNWPPSARQAADNASPTASLGAPSRDSFHSRTATSGYARQEKIPILSSVHTSTKSSPAQLNEWASIAPELGQNAISILLQPPRTQTGLLPTPISTFHKTPARGIPPVTLSDIPQVDPAEFQPYLARVGILYEQARRTYEDESEDGDVFHGRTGGADESLTAFHKGHLQPSRWPSPNEKSSNSSISSFSQADPTTKQGSSPAFSKRLAQASSFLSTIPRVYFDEDFQLENPRIFDVVTENSEITHFPPSRVTTKTLTVMGTPTAPRKALATNAILQEKLSWYMDTIEMHLTASSSAASSTFFAVLGSLQGLHAEVIDSVERIKGLRQDLQSLDETIARNGLTVIQKRQRCENIQQLQDAVSQLRHVIDCIAGCESLVDDGELEKALESIESLEKVVVGEEYPSKQLFSENSHLIQLRDIREAAALQGFDDDLCTLRLRVGKSYESRFVGLLIRDLRRHSETVSAREVLMRWSSASLRSRGGQTPEPPSFPSYMECTDGLRSELLGTLIGLHRARHLTVAAGIYRHAALKELNGLVRRSLPSSNEDDNESMSSVCSGNRHLTQQQKSSILARNLQNLEPADAEELLIKIYINVTEMLRRLTTQVKLLLDVASSMGDGTSVSSASELSGVSSSLTSSAVSKTSVSASEMQAIHKAIDESSLLGEAVDIAQEKIVTILRVRSEQTTRLSLKWFLRYFTLNLYFAHECESVTGRSGAILKTVVNAPCRHGKKQRLAQAMESDKWEAKDFSEKDTNELQSIVSSSLKDPTAWLEGLRLWTSNPDDAADPRPSTEQQASSDGKTKILTASIDGKLYLLPNSAILCMKGISQFLQLILGIPSMASDIGLCLSSYIQLFNSRGEELVLGAEARKSAGLRNITSKHLAVASQALAFLAVVVRYACEFIRRYTASGATESALIELDSVRNLCQEHQSKIYNKIVGIMAGLVASHAQKLTSVDWDDSSEQVHPYI
ncbi:hypothetical protein LLEC1_01115 [Akanthomyces lecanii]|uniref:Vacuolar protein sorting-associated protein 54 C-terminal domain-containing protein n=1 Tax=Cordyceps confragosa TaxID=2714763 RepID=A0A179I7C4_CORDF|nr:hypothetical protein LLEC1_01115 [Akanthomyces lecanii]